MKGQPPTLARPGAAALVGLVLFLAACAPVGPEYQAPGREAPAEWHSPIDSGLRLALGEGSEEVSWWQGLGDPLLASYVGQALANNHGLTETRAAVLSARARRALSASTLLPSAALGASLARQGSFESGSDPSSRYASSFDTLWELDLFGGGRRTVEAAEQRVAAEEARLGDVQIALCAEVAQTYLQIRTFQRRAEIAAASLAAQQRLLALAEAKQRAGLIGEAAVHQVRAQAAATRAQLPVLDAGRAEAEYLLATLLGRVPGSLAKELEQERGRLAVPEVVAVAIPAVVLERRPDVRRAERLLAAQVAEIGAAEAARYPTVRLSGGIGFDALSLGQLFAAASGSYAITPSISWSLFDGGATEANIALQSSLAEAALAAFKDTVLAALAEVETAISDYLREKERLAALSESERAAARSLALVEGQYQAGLVEMSAVLEAHRTLLSAEDQRAVSSASVIGNLVKLYKALGGGWDHADHPSQSQGGNGGV